jgi:hypothetical protein
MSFPFPVRWMARASRGASRLRETRPARDGRGRVAISRLFLLRAAACGLFEDGRLAPRGLGQQRRRRLSSPAWGFAPAPSSRGKKAGFGRPTLSLRPDPAGRVHAGR